MSHGALCGHNVEISVVHTTNWAESHGKWHGPLRCLIHVEDNDVHGINHGAS